MRHTAALIEFLKASLNLIQLPAFRLDKRRDGLTGEKRFRATCALGERLEPFLRIGVDANDDADFRW